ncbi:MAG: nitrile hydratase subunit beta [Candidatus Latescibacterota bacterium]|nr:nitrile hydratase subunit beta [Candidatus Latescibacterota bacterium]
MDGVHDMGGMHGFGPLEIEDDEALFHGEWEGRVLGMARLTPVHIPGGMRNAIEQLDPAEYLRSSYYEKWLHARIEGCIAAGAITREEFDATLAYYSEHPEAEIPQAQSGEKPVAAERPAATPPVPSPTFAVGDRVRARQVHPRGHTRLPRYIRGKVGEVVQVYRPQGFQDAEPLDDTVGPQPVYAVRFAGGEVWGESAEPNSCVLMDMWESYLERVPA